MHVNKKFDRFKQWAGEKMGGEAKTNTSEDFKALEAEMNLRHDGMERLHKSMSIFVKHVGKRSEGDDRDKQLAVAFLGSTMVAHGSDFAPDSEFGNCLQQFGRANEAIGRKQDTFVAQSTTVWLESLERSLAQLKEYQAARKKLEARRLAYDASLAKMQKARKEDFRVEEELRAQKAKYEESSEDVYRRMEDIKEAEAESVGDLTQFLEAELDYHDQCRNVLLELRRNWPVNEDPRKLARHRSTTAHNYAERIQAPVEEEPPAPTPPARTTIPKVSRADSLRRTEYEGGSNGGSGNASPRLSRTNSLMSREYDSGPTTTSPGGLIGSTSMTLTRYSSNPTSGPSCGNSYRDSRDSINERDYSPERQVPSRGSTTSGGESMYARTPLRSLTAGPGGHAEWRENGAGSPFANNNGYGGGGGLNNKYNGAEWALAGPGSNGVVVVKKGPPPPPPSRAKKPAPPPPMKRAAFSETLVSHSPH